MQDYLNRYYTWQYSAKDKLVKKQLDKIKGNDEQIKDAFFKDIEFGTGGLRGVLGVGTNCMNVYTVARVTCGIANVMVSQNLKRVAVSFDSRIMSHEFSCVVASVFAKFGIEVFLTKECQPTPFLSFMVRELKADIGVMITASHNPAKYNGYKVYDSDGCQLTDVRASEMLEAIEKVNPFKVEFKNFKGYLKKGIVKYIDKSIEEKYKAKVLEQSVLKEKLNNLSVVFTPLNGAGHKLAPEMIKAAGVKNLYSVASQSKPDGRFLTCPNPNPEKAEALQLAIEKAKKVNADLVIATDPDADRVGIAVLEVQDYKLLTGNETGILLTDFIFSSREQSGTLSENPVFIKTIVSSPLATKVAKKYNATCIDVLTGFKYIGEQIKKLEVKGKESSFIFGMEESYGYLAGSYVRDKDAIVTSMLIAEMASYYKGMGKTLVDRINEIYAEYGEYSHKLLSLKFEGADGFSCMNLLLKNLREKKLKEIAGLKVLKAIDYLTQKEFDLPKANVLVYDLEKGAQLIIRPSGTEPLLKCYLTAAETKEKNAATIEKLEEFSKEIFR